MSDLISRQAAIDETWKEPEYTDPLNVLTEIRDRLMALPTIEPERKKGKWIDWYKRQTCSVCKQRGYRSWNFCPNCGADMREREGAQDD